MLTLAVGAAVAVHTAFAFATDLASRRIPNLWNIAAASAGMVVHGAAGGWKGWAASAAGCAVLFAVTFALQLAGAIGGGDAKWFAALGSWTGAAFAFHTLLNAVLAAGLMALVHFLWKGTWRNVTRRWTAAAWLALSARSAVPVGAARSLAERKEMPFMIAVLPAVIVTAWQWEGSGRTWWTVF